MNNQTNSDDYVYVYESLDTALNIYLSMFGEYFWVCVYFPTAVIGFFLNVLNLAIFWQKEFNIKLYTYFRVLTFSSMMIILVASPYPFSMVKRLGFISNFAFQNWMCYVYTPIASTFFYNANVIEILVQIDRLATFIKKLKAIYEKVKPQYLCIICFCVCLAINFPFFFHI
jgi:hypothetical protein